MNRNQPTTKSSPRGTTVKRRLAVALLLQAAAVARAVRGVERGGDQAIEPVEAVAGLAGPPGDGEVPVVGDPNGRQLVDATVERAHPLARAGRQAVRAELPEAHLARAYLAGIAGDALAPGDHRAAVRGDAGARIEGRRGADQGLRDHRLAVGVDPLGVDPSVAERPGRVGPGHQEAARVVDADARHAGDADLGVEVQRAGDRIPLGVEDPAHQVEAAVAGLAPHDQHTAGRRHRHGGLDTGIGVSDGHLGGGRLAERVQDPQLYRVPGAAGVQEQPRGGCPRARRRQRDVALRLGGDLGEGAHLAGRTDLAIEAIVGADLDPVRVVGAIDDAGPADEKPAVGPGCERRIKEVDGAVVRPQVGLRQDEPLPDRDRNDLLSAGRRSGDQHGEKGREENGSDDCGVERTKGPAKLGHAILRCLLVMIRARWIRGSDRASSWSGICARTVSPRS